MKPFICNIEFKKQIKNPKNLSDKLHNLFVAYPEVVESYKLELAGLLDIVQGLEYHYKNFEKIEKRYINSQEKLFSEGILHPRPNNKNMIHEIVAYLNRLGQLDSLVRSPWFNSCTLEEEIGKNCSIFLAIMPFRSKFAAHRSVDYPRKIDTEHQKASQANLPFGIKSRGKIGDRHKVSYDIFCAKADRHQFLKKYHKPLVNGVEFSIDEEVMNLIFIPTDNCKRIFDEILDITTLFFEKNSCKK